MKRIMIACVVVAAFAAPALAGGLAPNRANDASVTFNPSNPDMTTTYPSVSGGTLVVKNIGTIFSDRAGENASINIDWMNLNGMNIPAHGLQH